MYLHPSSIPLQSFRSISLQSTTCGFFSRFQDLQVLVPRTLILDLFLALTSASRTWDFGIGIWAFVVADADADEVQGN